MSAAAGLRRPAPRTAHGVLGAIAAAGVVGVFLVPPIAQDPSYHLFADGRAIGAIPNGLNVLSNLAFPVVGVAGLVWLAGEGGRAVRARAWARWSFGIFFAGIALVGAGSVYYHWAPDNETLLWDRLPMTIAFMALFAGFIADRIDARVGLWLMAPLLLVGAASVLHWYLGERAGAGDLRLYGLVQFLPIVLIPVMCRLCAGGLTSGRAVAWMVAWYALAKLCEYFDHAIYQASGALVSGHTLKHLFAAAAGAVILFMLRGAATARASSRGA